MLTTTRKKTAESIVNLFETGEVLGDYGQVTVISGDTGHLTFGRSQTTLGSGNLYELLYRYCTNDGGLGFRLTPYLPALKARDTELDYDSKLHNLLRATADDLVMRDVQDSFFDEFYWRRAARTCEQDGIATPLGVAVVYDSFIHGSWKAMRDRTNTQTGDAATVGERGWVAAYVKIRRAWLAGHSRTDLRTTVYRMDAFQSLIDQGLWNLELPLVVRGREISTASLSALPPGCYESPQPGTRVLSLQSPLQRGLDVRRVQLALSHSGIDIKADGVFGQHSSRSIKKYQAAHNLTASGVADVLLISRLANLNQ